MSVASKISGTGGDLGEVQIAMLKKAQTADASKANQLIANLPQVPAARAASAAGVGVKVDVTG